MIKQIKTLLKKYLLYYFIKDRFAPSVQVGQRQLYLGYQDLARKGNLPKLNETGFKVFSQFEEDGLLLYIFSLLGMDSNTFIEIGADDGVNSNSANLYFNFGWKGLFIDANSTSISRGQRFYAKHPHPYFYPPKFICSKVYRSNVNKLISEAGFTGKIGLLSIDIDGNDYWIWDAIDVVEPMVVVIETHIEMGLDNLVVPYDENYFYPGKHPQYHGASPTAMTILAKKKGYRLVGANDLGFNFIFVKNGLGEELLPEVSVESVLQHPSAIEGRSKFKEVRDWEYLQA